MRSLNPAPFTASAELQAQSRAQACAAHLARLALRSLYQELALFPKPGLVSLVDSGSHSDMDASSFLRSLFAIRHYFRAIALAGWRGAAFAELRQLGMQAEHAMLRATGGVNTHRGAIFSLGLLCAAAARVQGQGLAIDAQNWRAALRQHWGGDLLAHQSRQFDDSHGARMAQRYACGGARAQAAQAFPLLFEYALPLMQAELQQGRPVQEARLHTLFALIATLPDSNLLYRGGVPGAAFARNAAQDWLQAGACQAPDWQARALALHHAFIARRLSPGGAADMLAAACFAHQVLHEAA
ncbi:triphosphoribosyl-dephospho-CoA synthase MdcB [Massilia sp. W12]|uniref:triphosphoribosyl-dephospho-CoA synthase MdcB n=1 Tax=Massilia sp. W12 TaxID=3126507 RepID=UPI0030CC7BB1